MLQLRENEKVVLVVRKHWFVMARTLLLFLFLVLIPPVVLTLLPWVSTQSDATRIEPVTNFFLALYMMVLILFLFLFWMEYYLDMWIITSERVVDINQRGLFNREVSEIPLQNIEDVTIEINGVIETFLKFGTLKIQTAGEREFIIDQAPHLYEAKSAILAHIGPREKKRPPSTPEQAPHQP